jgi:two-component system, sensor histidine kinase and response regulator
MTTPSLNPPATPGPRSAILLVDDQPKNLTALEATLEPLGHRLVSVTSGEEALRKLLTERFAVIILDVMMPGIDGFETAAAIRARDESGQTPIVFLTALGKSKEDVARGYDLGAVDYLVKPYDPNAVRSRVQVLVDLFRFQDALARQTEELERSNAELEQFAYVASHDLQQPLRMVASYTALLADEYEGQLDEQADRWIGYAVDGAKRMQQLVDDLLAFSRLGRELKAFASIDLQEVVDLALLNLEVAIKESGAVVTHGALPVVTGDRGQLLQLIQNLVANSIKFHGDEPPTVHVGAVLVGDMWRVSVRDNGIGIDAAYLERVFLIFQRLHGRKKYEGSGMGLAIAKKIVERHGGQISIESEPGTGTTIHFTLARGGPT